MAEVISYNPATLEEVGRVPVMSDDEVRERAETARRAQTHWQRLSYGDRASYLLRARAYLLDHAEEFARTITLDNGKPLAESVIAEVYPVAELIHYFAHHTGRLLRSFHQPIGIMGALRRSSRIEYRPIGVIGIISPWNYPFTIPVGEAVMALMAGNTVLLKPSSITPMVGLRIAEMFAAADLPEGVFTHLSGDSTTGQALIDAHPDKLLFTGSVDVGKKIMASCASALTPVVLELGGKDPMVVRADADIDYSSSGAVWGAFTNCGQTCASVERVYVHEKIYDSFVKAVVEKTARLKVGNGVEASIDVGPLTTENQLNTVEAQVDDARKRGATVEIGGKRPDDLRGYFYMPTVITGVDHTFMCMQEETFGPLMPIMRFTSDEEAIKLANDSRFGLTASIWTGDIAAGQAMARRIQAGTVTINEAVYTHALCQTPWGGVKESGFGRSHSRFGLLELVQPHHIHTNRWQRESIWWYGYNKPMYDNFIKLARHLTGGWFSKIKSLPSFLKAFFLKKN